MRSIAALVLVIALTATAQTPTPPPEAPVAPSSGKVILHREEKPPADPDSDPPTAPTTPPSAPAVSSSQPAAASAVPEPPDADITVSDAERDAVTFTAYDLDLHLTPATAALEAHVNFTVRNDGPVPLTRLALQISSSLVWESLRLRSDLSGNAAAFVQHRINTDADHTGVAREAVLTLPVPLAPRASVNLAALYGGSIPASAERLERIGAPDDQADAADWDTVATDGTALRGYGNVLWYPVSSAPVFLGDGAKLFDAVGRARLRQQTATIRLRLTIEFTGDAPDAAYFCGRRQPLAIFSDNDGLPVAAAPGIATAEFAAQPLGFRIPSLFVTDRAPTMTDGNLIRAVTDHEDALAVYANAAAKVQPLLMDWLGTDPLAPLDILDHPGQPFEDAALLVTPLQTGSNRPTDAATLAPVLVHTLAHAWFASSHAWLDEGVAQFLSLLWVETNDGKQAGLAHLQSSASAISLAEPDLSSKTATAAKGQSLIDASSEIYYRNKAAAVLWMLRSYTGDEALKQALQTYRKSRTADASPTGFEEVLEQASHKDLKWFFDDWVYNDRGLPELTIAHVAPRALPDKGGKSAGFLVAVDVHNDGAAIADVPVTVRSIMNSVTERLRIAGHSDAATRILFEGTPEEVVVNDGTVPEVRDTIHTAKILVKTE
jgi:hypothetical protein